MKAYLIVEEITDFIGQTEQNVVAIASTKYIAESICKERPDELYYLELPYLLEKS